MRLTLPAAAVTAADTDARRIAGVTVPYGQPGRTSAGVLRVRAGALDLPEPLTACKLLFGHDRDRPVGAAVDADDTPERLALTFAVTRNHDGDTLLAELDPDAPARDGLSVELDDVTVDDGEVTAGRLVAVAAVPLPAFATARAALAAEHTPERTDPAMPDDSPTAPVTATDNAASPAATLLATPRAAPEHRDPVDVLAASIRAGLKPAQVEAALADFTDASPATPDQWVGQLWTPDNVRRMFIDSVSKAALTSVKVTGWRWTAGVVVDDWTGGKTAIPSNAPALEAVEVTAKFLAGGVDIAREWVDLGSAQIVRDIIAYSLRDYAYKTESAAVTAALAGSTALPANADPVGQLIDVASELLALGLNIDFVYCGKSVYTSLVKSASGFDFLAGLANIAGGSADVGRLTVRPHPGLPDDTVLAGDRRSFTFYEKNPPVQVSAVDIARGGLDEAVHGYYATLVNHAPGLLKIAQA